MCSSLTESSDRPSTESLMPEIEQGPPVHLKTIGLGHVETPEAQELAAKRPSWPYGQLTDKLSGTTGPLPQAGRLLTQREGIVWSINTFKCEFLLIIRVRGRIRWRLFPRLTELEQSIVLILTAVFGEARRLCFCPYGSPLISFRCQSGLGLSSLLNSFSDLWRTFGQAPPFGGLRKIVSQWWFKPWHLETNQHFLSSVAVGSLFLASWAFRMQLHLVFSSFRFRFAFGFFFFVFASRPLGYIGSIKWVADVTQWFIQAWFIILWKLFLIIFFDNIHFLLVNLFSAISSDGLDELFCGIIHILISRFQKVSQLLFPVSFSLIFYFEPRCLFFIWWIFRIDLAVVFMDLLKDGRLSKLLKGSVSGWCEYVAFCSFDIV